MTPGEVAWTPALLVLAIGVVLGVALLWRLRAARHAARGPAKPTTDPSDLEARRDAALARLRELDQEASNKPASTLAHERQKLELDAARALMEMDRLAAAPRTLPAQGPARGSALRGFLWGVGSAAALALLLYFASQSATTRQDAPATVPDSQPTPSATADAEAAALRARIEKAPEDLSARLDLARHALAANDMMTVFKETRFVLDRKPTDPRGLTYQAVVRLAMGQPKKAEEMLERAIAAQPALEDAYVYLMLVHTEARNAHAADSVLARATAHLPSQAEELRSVLARMRSEASASAASARELPENPHAALDAGAQPDSQAATATAPAGQSVSGTVDLAAAVQRPTSPRAAIYVVVRRTGQTSGPPLAVKRFPLTSLPAPFEISTADSMTGAALGGNLRVEARLAVDGDATKPTKGEARAFVDNVPLGAHDVHLTLAPLP
jgi:cytochrome c-type biogenesis protein CcmH